MKRCVAMKRHVKMKRRIKIKRCVEMKRHIKTKRCMRTKRHTETKRHMKIKKRVKMINCVNGSFTVEAAMIAPLMIFLIVTVIYIAFNLHNQSVTKNYCTYVAQMISQSAFKYMQLPQKSLDGEKEFKVTWSDQWEDEFKINVSNIQNQVQLDLEQSLLAAKIKNIEITYQYHNLTEQVICEVRAEGTTLFPFKLFGKQQLGFAVRCEGKSYDESKIIWKTNLIKGDGQTD